MNNKNQRIAASLARMSLNFSNISRDLMEINGILLEKQESLPHTFSKLPNEKSNNAVITAYEKQAQLTTLITRIGLDNSLKCKKILTNRTTIFYKRVQGPMRGTILTVNRKTQQITDHKYLVTKNVDEQLALTSHDADGIWYVQNVIRPSLQKLRGGMKIVRYYRPNSNSRGILEKSTHCAIYARDH